MKNAVAGGVDVSASPFMRLRNAAEPMPGNASRTYLKIERE